MQSLVDAKHSEAECLIKSLSKVPGKRTAMAKELPKIAGISFFNPIAFRKAKIVCNFGLSECHRVNIALSLQCCACVGHLIGCCFVVLHPGKHLRSCPDGQLT